jgi:hypothetical protein
MYSKKVLAGLAVLPIGGALFAGSLAMANWANTGSGSSTVVTTQPVADTMTGTNTGIYPGDSFSFVVTIHNSNSYSEHLASITVTHVVDTTTAAGDSDVAIAGATYTTPVQVVPANGTLNETLTATMISAPLGNPGDTYTATTTATLVAGS